MKNCLQSEFLLTLSQSGLVTSRAVSAANCKGWTFAITCITATIAEIRFQGDIKGAWRDIHVENLTTPFTGNKMIRDLNGQYDKIRANVTSYSSGLFVVVAGGSLVQ